MQLVALISTLLLLLQTIAVLTTTTNANNMDSANPAGVRRDDKGPVNITLSVPGDSGEPKRIFDDSNVDNGVSRNDLSFGDSCQGDIDNELPGSAKNDEPEGWTSHTVYSGNSEDPCQQIMMTTRSNDLPCLPGDSSGLTISGAAVEGCEGGGHDPVTQNKAGENEKKKKKKKRAVRATLYTCRYEGMLYDVPIHSSLGEAYRNLSPRRRGASS